MYTTLFPIGKETAMKQVFKMAATLLVAVILLTATGCNADYKNAHLYFELSEKPVSVDPQTASSVSELLIVRNIYEGLLRKNESGAITKGVAESYETDGLTYTFRLREDAHWQTGDPVTANDFVFALRRAVLPATKSPFVSRLFCIVNAREIQAGQLDVSELGVTAPDERTLIITLSAANESFTDTLTTSICMPCNEAFFNQSVGKYGLSQQYILANGSYYVGKWNQEDFGIRLYKNEEYTGNYSANNAAVFLSKSKDSDALTLLSDESVDAAFIDNGSIGKAKTLGFSVASCENICWILTMSEDFNRDTRKALSMLVSGDIYGKNLPDGCRTASSLFPAVFAPPDPVSGAGETTYDPDGAKELFAKAVQKMPDKKFPQTTLYYYKNDNMKLAVTDIVAHWQQNLSAFINIEAVDSLSKFSVQPNQSGFPLAIFPIRAENGSLEEYLLNFGIDYNGEDLSAVQTELLFANHIIPIAFENTNVAYSSALTGLYTEAGNGYLDFSFVIKQE